MQDSEQRIIKFQYKMLHPLGEGGMGIVYRGVDLHSDKPVAIKLLKLDEIAKHPDRVERFKREAEAIRQIDHPNIVNVIDTFVDRDMHYIIMDYVDGGSLRALLDDSKKLPLRLALEMALDLADALVRTHRMKIVHRDIKPGNVLLDRLGTPYLTDFGSAHIAEASALTQPGVVIGTYHYIPPELLLGEAADPRSDVWSLGIMLYEMITGYRPFMASSAPDLFAAILKQPVPDPQKLTPECPPVLAELLYGMLHKDREQRVFSMRQVGARLEEALLLL